VVLGITVDATEKMIQQAYRMRSLKYHPDRKGGSTRAFQRIAAAFHTLSDPIKRADYDRGGDVKTKRAGAESDSEEEDEAHKTSLREEIERKYFPERYEYLPFGDPFIHKRKREERRRRQEGRPQWFDEDY
jgi:DnaJ-class molecular chaperone